MKESIGRKSKATALTDLSQVGKLYFLQLSYMNDAYYKLGQFLFANGIQITHVFFLISFFNKLNETTSFFIYRMFWNFGFIFQLKEKCFMILTVSTKNSKTVSAFSTNIPPLPIFSENRQNLEKL